MHRVPSARAIARIPNDEGAAPCRAPRVLSPHLEPRGEHLSRRLLLRIAVMGLAGWCLIPYPAAAASAGHVSSGDSHTCAVGTDGRVWCWGRNTYGQLGNGTTADSLTPVEVTGLTERAVSVAAGGQFTCVLTADGFVKCWGENTHGQLGDGTTSSRAIPGDYAVLGTAARSITAGRDHACAVDVYSQLRCWGRNDDGQLGDSTNTDQPESRIIYGLGGAADSAEAGAYHTCAVKTSGEVLCWGYNGYGQLGDGTTTSRNAPTTVSGLSTGGRAVSAGYYHTCVLSTLGGVVCWGANEAGQLGDGTTTNRTILVGASGLMSGIASISAGGYHTCAMSATGGAKCWGANAHGRLGDGTTTTRLTPVDVTGLTAGVASLEGGALHSCGLLANGGVKCWGYNGWGQIGDGTTTDRHAPTSVPGLTGGEGASAAGARRISAGEMHACAVTNAGGVQCWGWNGYGGLGDGTTTDRLVPTDVRGLSSGVAAVAVGGAHTCALTAAGGVKCWGWNEFGQLGDGTTTYRTVPVDVSGLTSGVSAIAAGSGHTCAVTTSGGLKCWGKNYAGQVGDGSTADRTTPVTVSGMTSGVAAVDCGVIHTCATTTSGGLRCWGDNAYGQLGDGTTVDRHTPVWVSGLTSGAAGVSAGDSHSCAVTSTGGVQCWGYNSVGQLGDGTTVDRLVPVNVVGMAAGVSTVDSGASQTCSVLDGGAVRCWGRNIYGEVGDGTTIQRTTPVSVSGLAAGVAGVSAGYGFTCAVTSRHGVQCWGWNEYGQLGNGASGGYLVTPAWVTGLVNGGGALDAGSSHACRLTAAGGVQCWGAGDQGQIGDGARADRRTPVDVSGLSSGVVAVAAAGDFSCALTAVGGVKCWGDNTYGQIGDGTTSDRAAPVDVTGLTSGAAALGLGDNHACVLTASGGVKCWGANDYGQLGDGTTTNRHAPVWVVGLTGGATSVASGLRHACAVTAFGDVRCWGWNQYGQLGDNTTTNRSTPVPVWPVTGAVAVAGGHSHSCVLLGGGGVKCWGRNTDGQLGDATTTQRLVPVDVIGMTSGALAITTGWYHSCALTTAGPKCWGSNAYGQLGDGGGSSRTTPVAVSNVAAEAGRLAGGTHFTCAVIETGAMKCWGANYSGQIGDGTETGRYVPALVRGFKLNHDFDADVKADVAVYRPSTGTWFSLNSSTGNATYQARGWGVQAQGDTPVTGDFDGDGIVDPAVFRPAAGTWFILESHASYTTWSFFGWGATGDTLVPADYDGDGKTDGAVYRPSTGTWYIRPSGGGAQWNVVFGNATDVPIPGHWDSDGKADIAVYRPSTGTWFVLTSSSGYTSYWYRGWGVQAQGDSPAPGDYDGDGRLDLCVFRASTGTWFILESGANFTTWNWFGWGASGDTLVPTDFDGDGITDAAIYRSSTYMWYVRPSSGATPWNVVFGAAGDVSLITIR